MKLAIDTLIEKLENQIRANADNLDKQYVLNSINDTLNHTYQSTTLLEKTKFPENGLNDDDETFYINAHKELESEYENLLTVRTMVNKWPDEGLVDTRTVDALIDQLTALKVDNKKNNEIATKISTLADKKTATEFDAILIK